MILVPKKIHFSLHGELGDVSGYVFYKSLTFNRVCVWIIYTANKRRAEVEKN